MKMELIRDMRLPEYLLYMLSYEGHEMLMNPITGSVDSASNWALESNDWDFSRNECLDQFSTLICVEKSETGEWKEIE